MGGRDCSCLCDRQLVAREGVLTRRNAKVLLDPQQRIEPDTRHIGGHS